MASKKSRSAKQEPKASRPTRPTLATLEGQIVQQLQDYAAAVIDRPRSGDVEKALERVVRPERVRQLLRRADGPLEETVVQAILRELVAGIRQAGQPSRVAFLGPLHSYSHLATLRHFGASAELVPVRTISAVFEEVISGQADAGVVPIENSTDGRIVDTLELLTRAPVKICGEVPLPIHHCLLGTGKRADVKEVCSKPQALSQCREWLAQHLPAAKVTHTSSTTAAAEQAKRDPTVAAIASYQAGVEYGLRALAKNIEDNPHNVTRFAVIGLEMADKTKADKTSLMFELAHQPGALAEAMAIFKRNRLNLTWIESFPKPQSSHEYLFFVELVGHATDLKVRRALASLAKKTVRLDVLGSYALAEPSSD